MKHPIPYLATLLSLFLFSCSEDPSSVQAGSISGYVYLISDSGAYVTERSGVTVSLEGTEYSGVSEADGRWTIENVPRGIYDIRLTKPGYSHIRIFSVQFIGGDEYFHQEPINLHQLPSFTISVQDVLPVPDTLNEFRIFGTFSDSLWWKSRNTNWRFACFYSTGPSPEVMYSVSHYLSFYKGFFDTDGEFEVVVSLAHLGLNPGTTVYLVVVPMTYGSAHTSTYYDPHIDQYLYTGIKEDGASEVFSVTTQ